MKQNLKSKSSKAVKEIKKVGGKAISAAKKAAPDSKIAGIERGTLITAGAVVAGAAVLGVAGFLAWKNKDKIMSTLGNLKDESTDFFKKHASTESEDVSEDDHYGIARGDDDRTLHQM